MDHHADVPPLPTLTPQQIAEGVEPEDLLSDEEILARCDAGREMQRQMDMAHGLAMMGARDWSEEAKLASFMNVFHPEHPATPRTTSEARQMMGRP